VGLLAAALLCPAPLRAAVTSETLRGIAVEPRSGASLPANIVLTDERGRRGALADFIQGKPAVLIFADYTCRTLCGPALSFVADALAQSGLKPDDDYRLLVIGLDAKDGAEQARNMQRARLAGLPRLQASSSFLTADSVSIAKLTQAAGYHFTYDEEHDQFAHPAAAFVLTPDLRIARALSELGMTAESIRLALVEASAGRIGGLTDHIRLLCYGFDPASGTYNVAIRRILAAASIVTILALGGGIGLLIAAGPRRS
jgi:protein SCO1/2